VIRFDPDQVSPESVEMKRAELRLPQVLRSSVLLGDRYARRGFWIFSQLPN
jgi:hypothetical protein